MKYPLSMRRAASVKALMELKDVSLDDAQAIRKAWQTVCKRSEARDAIDTILRTHGVEYLGWHKRNHEHIYYCNTGDLYNLTVIFAGLRMYVGCCADMVEKNLIAEQYQY